MKLTVELHVWMERIETQQHIGLLINPRIRCIQLMLFNKFFQSLKYFTVEYVSVVLHLCLNENNRSCRGSIY